MILPLEYRAEDPVAGHELLNHAAAKLILWIDRFLS